MKKVFSVLILLCFLFSMTAISVFAEDTAPKADEPTVTATDNQGTEETGAAKEDKGIVMEVYREIEAFLKNLDWKIVSIVAVLFVAILDVIVTTGKTNRTNEKPEDLYDDEDEDEGEDLC